MTKQVKYCVRNYKNNNSNNNEGWKEQCAGEEREQHDKGTKINFCVNFLQSVFLCFV